MVRESGEEVEPASGGRAASSRKAARVFMVGFGSMTVTVVVDGRISAYLFIVV